MAARVTFVQRFGGFFGYASRYLAPSTAGTTVNLPGAMSRAK
ncbi:MAG: hypothetical protein Q8S73_03220 [Deltaproteobacteria bacterium]|nr:hypothetical protein [Myxococcales bacterium]MDP3213091.1 hypothetical protein [Deltaproteobacteria bacterium]